MENGCKPLPQSPPIEGSWYPPSTSSYVDRAAPSGFLPSFSTFAPRISGSSVDETTANSHLVTTTAFLAAGHPTISYTTGFSHYLTNMEKLPVVPKCSDQHIKHFKLSNLTHDSKADSGELSSSQPKLHITLNHLPHATIAVDYSMTFLSYDSQQMRRRLLWMTTMTNQLPAQRRNCLEVLLLISVKTAVEKMLF